MSDAQGRTRIAVGKAYLLAVEEPAEVLQRISEGEGDWFQVTTTTGQTAFPPEEAWVRKSDVLYLQTLSDEAWVWQQESDSQHYARLLQETTGERLAGAQEALVDYLKQLQEKDEE